MAEQKNRIEGSLDLFDGTQRDNHLPFHRHLFGTDEIKGTKEVFLAADESPHKNSSWVLG